ncbi:hypothetical protein [Streptomyces sp. ML-6]|uniref:hypothetical protein n=1 Tax=Streptomyces sp. ML-6 TaxID=2982693 RepID=UPI0024C07374|nr:hypothetical protein [Streptomyces sp. ML-6]MDK0522406.1 hypothetical protein [Streptomyces sp. ML-6]
MVEALQIPLPSIEEQRKAVEAVALLDARIAAQRAVVAKLRAAQSGVVEGLLSGGAHAMAA